MSVTGMNIEEVRALGNHLCNQAPTELSNVMTAIENKVLAANWTGNDANRFKNELWPSHKAQIQRICDELLQFGQLANQNATAQETTSNNV